MTVKQTSPEKAAQAATRITIINDVLNTRSTSWSPQSVQDALRNHGEVAQARIYLDMLDCVRQEERDREPIGCSIRHNNDSIAVYWFVTGDLESAREAMQDAIDSGRAWL